MPLPAEKGNGAAKGWREFFPLSFSMAHQANKRYKSTQVFDGQLEGKSPNHMLFQ
jgi:hypothetical protein